MEENYIHRDIETVVKEAAQYFPVITITGPRQSGKTTMIKHLFENLKYYSLEDLDTRSLAEEDPVRFLHLHENGMILDEVHNAPQLLSYIQGIVDENPGKRFILSGSSNFALLKKVSQSLAGRTGVFELLPFSYKEVGNIDYINNVDELLFNGLYPAICGGKNIPRFLYPAYIKTYLDKDVRDLLAIKNMTQFNIFLRLCAGRIGSIFNASEIANEVGVSSATIQSWMSILQASYIIYLMPPYFDNSRKRLTKSPKLYFCDTGLACCLLGIENPEQLTFHKMRGHLFENLIVIELLKRRLNEGKESDLYFYRDSNQNEILILKGNINTMEAIEIKSSMTYSQSFAKALQKVNGWIKAEITHKKIVYAGELEDPNSEIRLINFRNL